MTDGEKTSYAMPTFFSIFNQISHANRSHTNGAFFSNFINFITVSGGFRNAIYFLYYSRDRHSGHKGVVMSREPVLCPRTVTRVTAPFKWTHADVVVLISLYSLARFLILFRTMGVLRTTRIANWSEFKSWRCLLCGEMSPISVCGPIVILIESGVVR